MKVLHTITSVDRDSGGTSTYMKSLADQLSYGINVSLIAKNTLSPLKFNPRVNVQLFNFSSVPFLNESEITKYFNNTTADIYHGNGLWQFPVHFMARFARNKKLPYIISPHGMLEPWSMMQSKWKKRMAMFLFQQKDLKSAAVLHVTSDMEAKNVRALGYKNPIAVTPNGIDLEEFKVLKKGNKKTKKTILFLSRIHPKKGIENLIDAWKKLDYSLKFNWQVEIAGNGELAYINRLQNSIEENGLSKEIKIIGPQFGKEKQDTYNRADLFVLPTHSENFGIVIAEALACNTPVITTKGAPWEKLESTHSGWWIDFGIAPLKAAFEEALQTPSATLFQMGENGRKLVEEKYSIEAVAKQMLELYTWVLEKGKKPEFVNLV